MLAEGKHATGGDEFRVVSFEQMAHDNTPNLVCSLGASHGGRQGQSAEVGELELIAT